MQWYANSSEYLNDIYNNTEQSQLSKVSSTSENEIEQLQMEINRWKSVNSQLLHLLQKNTL